MKHTTREQLWLARVKALPCVLCRLLQDKQDTPTEVHHAREERGTGQRGGHFCTIALCVDCHRSSIGFHGNRTLMRIAKVDEMDLLDLTIDAVFKQMLKEQGR